MQGYLGLSLLAMVLFGINAVIYKLALNIDAVSLTLISFATSALATFIYWFFFVTDKQVSQQGVLLAVTGGVISVLAFIAFIRALQLGEASIVNTIRALSAAVTVIVAILVLGEKLTLLKGLGIVLAIVAAVLLSV